MLSLVVPSQSSSWVSILVLGLYSVAKVKCILGIAGNPLAKEAFPGAIKQPNARKRIARVEVTF